MEKKMKSTAPPKPLSLETPKIDLKDLPPINLTPVNNPTTLPKREKRFVDLFQPKPEKRFVDLFQSKPADDETTREAVRKNSSGMEGSTLPRSQENDKPQFFAGEDKTIVVLDKASVERDIHDPKKMPMPVKTQLHQVCAVKKWKLPVYECCKEEGPPHFKLFTFKVVIEIEEESRLLECFSAPRTRKKAAAAHAAEGALWYLESAGYLPLNKE